LLFNPPATEAELYKRGAAIVQSKVEPLGIAYLAAVLEEAGHDVRIIDGIAEKKSIEQIAGKAQHFDFVGVTACTSFAKRAYESVKAVKEISDAPIIFGGPHATVLPLEVVENQDIDFVVAGEGEYTILELVNALEKGKEVEKVKGLYFKKGKKVQFTGERQFVKNVDDIPMPARHLLQMHLYTGSESRSRRLPSHSLISSRGCPFNCSFCGHIFGRNFRPHSPERVLQEMELLVEKYKVRDLGFWDDNFTVDKKRVIKICEMVKERDWDITSSCEARVDCVDADVLKALKSAGCEFIAYGVESGSQPVLNSMRKGFVKDKVRETFKLTQKIGIGIRAYFLIGLPGETKEDILKTLQFAKELNPTIATFTLYTPLPGTDDYTKSVESGELKKPLYWHDEVLPDFNFLEKPICVPNGMTAEELLKLHKKAYWEYYLRPGYILQRLLSIRNLEDLGKMAKGFVTIMNT